MKKTHQGFLWNPWHSKQAYLKKYKLTPIGSGGKAFGGPITKFSLSFDFRAPLSREQLQG